MRDRVREGPSLCLAVADAAQDRYLDLLIAEAVETGRTVAAARPPWAGP